MVWDHSSPIGEGRQENRKDNLFKKRTTVCQCRRFQWDDRSGLVPEKDRYKVNPVHKDGSLPVMFSFSAFPYYSYPRDYVYEFWQCPSPRSWHSLRESTRGSSNLQPVGKYPVLTLKLRSAQPRFVSNKRCTGSDKRQLTTTLNGRSSYLEYRRKILLQRGLRGPAVKARLLTGRSEVRVLPLTLIFCPFLNILRNGRNIFVLFLFLQLKI